MEEEYLKIRMSDLQRIEIGQEEKAEEKIASRR